MDGSMVWTAVSYAVDSPLGDSFSESAYSSFIPAYKEYTRLEGLGTNSNLHQMAETYHKVSFVAAGACRQAFSTSHSYHMCRRKASNSDLCQRSP